MTRFDSRHATPERQPAWVQFAGDGALRCGGRWTLAHARELEEQILSEDTFGSDNYFLR